ncbi:MAG: sugar ABC transporter permease [Clostridiales bacterium]|jgi:ABC-type sugar transport system permease subunit|nr:sugar ABC transporter permease [Clostridiales bacterium]
MKKKKLTLTKKKIINGYMFILPWFVGFIIFYIRSIVLTAQFSLSELSVGAIGGYELKFVGLENFIYAFREHGTFKQVLTTSVGNIILDIPLIIFFSLFMSMLLNKEFKGRTVVRAIFFLPVILNSSAISGALELSQQMMAGGISAGSGQMIAEGSSTGVDVNYYINLFKDFAMPEAVLDYIVAAVGRINKIITASGVQIVIFIAALQSIPGSMYEVAKIEGATAYETFWRVTFPMVMPHIITNVVYTVIDNFAESEVVTLAYDMAFTSFDYGLSSVFSLVSTVIICLILVLICGFIQKRTFYYN